MTIRLLATTLLLMLPAVALPAQDDHEYSVKHLVFPEGCTVQDKISLAARLVPTKEQFGWQNLELTAFLHFGMNTFTGREWGDGKEDPSLFNPSSLDADQWIRTLSQARFKMAILTDKHHDGFCLWPTGTTSHSVASSGWKDGKGDVVREVRDACARYGMKFGVYLSPWDRNATCYGDSPAYNWFFIAQLTELLTDVSIRPGWFYTAAQDSRVKSTRPLVLNIGAKATLSAFTYAPLKSRAGAETAYRFSFAASDDGVSWKTVIKGGEFSDMMHNPVPMTVPFGSPADCLFIRIEASTLDGDAAEILPEEIGFTLSGKTKRRPANNRSS